MNGVAEEIYKDSGIEWLDSIPESWDIMRLKDIAIIETGGKNTEDKEQDGKYPFFVRSQTVEFINSYSFDGEAILTAGDGVGVGKVFHHYTGKFETHQRVYRISGFHKVNGRFLFHFVQANLSKEVLKFNVKATVDSLRMPMFQRFPVVLPPLHEQSVIAKFIDRHTAAIDRKIELLEQKIKLYHTLRKTLINETVCRGLNPNAPRKHSGIEWIGEIPAHWTVKRLKEVAKIVNGSTPSSSVSTYWDGEIVWITPADFGNEKFVHESAKKITKSGLANCGTTMVPAGTVILSARAPIGSLAIAGKPLCTNQGCKSLIPFGIHNIYLYYFLTNQTALLNSIGNGTIFKELSTSSLNNVALPLPPPEEQAEIIDYLDNKTAHLDTITTNLTAQIATLKELRKTLINDAVTGKINVTAQAQ